MDQRGTQIQSRFRLHGWVTQSYVHAIGKPNEEFADDGNEWIEDPVRIAEDGYK